ncbi:pyridoxamine 5'-phosphate oxidase family protein [Saccharothrix longispora]|uniref:PPOX class probable F420-dependent enzyme n=1 Tax=Saccharothrix longispora TaxID=33920 RepID=A0ABU1PRU9_9PSEU|nr:TIGR03618 family F420-dependent PPOX class oxidoreductase [Saccharothrix longispora]MDR6593363.1 PPOX class probable F420-dependent enzyme [Saccharothrix longispora]
MSRRALITMTPDEVAAFLEERRVVTVATVGRAGRPHLVPLWFAVEDGELLAWTYRASQKVANLRRTPEATLQLEAGESYEELRGVTMECDVRLVEERAEVARIGGAVAARYAGQSGPELDAFVAAQAVKRVGLRFTPTSVVSWDHRKLAGAY